MMGQYATLYRIEQDEFEILSQDPMKFKPKMAQGYVTFQQNAEGILFLLSKLATETEKPLVLEIFYPNTSIGESLDLDLDMNDIEALGDLESNSINYLDQAKIKAIKAFLDKTNKNDLLSLYSAQELNENGIYPCVWHNDEAPNRAFNKRHIAEGFDDLVRLFADAVNSDNLILTFVG